MTSIHKPKPLFKEKKPKKVCPVCGKVSYSLEGIHPQCKVEQAQARLSAEIIKARNGNGETPAAHDATGTWRKRCPACLNMLASGKALCDCGYRFG